MQTTPPEEYVLQAPTQLIAATRLEFRHAALDHLDRVVQARGARVFVELGATTEIDANGLGVLVLLQKRSREQMIAVRLLHPSAAVRQMLELTKLDYLFELEG